jgi:septal ring factor EnvC (AmiA/AmiB activator)
MDDLVSLAEHTNHRRAARSVAAPKQSSLTVWIYALTLISTIGITTAIAMLNTQRLRARVEQLESHQAGAEERMASLAQKINEQIEKNATLETEINRLKATIRGRAAWPHPSTTSSK